MTGVVLRAGPQIFGIQGEVIKAQDPADAPDGGFSSTLVLIALATLTANSSVSGVLQIFFVRLKGRNMLKPPSVVIKWKVRGPAGGTPARWG